MRRTSTNALKGYLFISPWLIGFFLFTLAPILATFYLSFTEYNIFDKPKWVGLDNYRYAFTSDDTFWLTVKNTLIYVVMFVPLSIVLGFLLALLLNTKVRGMTFFRTVFYVPSIVPSVASIILFVFMMDPDTGLLTVAADFIGFGKPNWLGDPQITKLSIAIMGLWGVGHGMIIYLAGLQGIPKELYEASEIDGAGKITQTTRITVPLMTPTLFFNLIMGLIGSFQIFNNAYIASANQGTGAANFGGPLHSYYFYVLKIYAEGFQYFKMGYAAALAWMLFVLIMIVTFFVFRSGKSWVHYN